MCMTLQGWREILKGVCRLVELSEAFCRTSGGVEGDGFWKTSAGYM